jgi:hypothetical protein
MSTDVAALGKALAANLALIWSFPSVTAFVSLSASVVASVWPKGMCYLEISALREALVASLGLAHLLGLASGTTPALARFKAYSRKASRPYALLHGSPNGSSERSSCHSRPRHIRTAFWTSLFGPEKGHE